MNIPTVTRNLLIINVLVFFASLVFGGYVQEEGQVSLLNNIFGLHFFLAPDFHFYQLITYMFMHAGVGHIFFNMFALWMFGCVVERVWGAKKFLFYYIMCGVGAGLFQELAQFVEFYLATSASGAEYSVMVAARYFAAEINQWTTVGASGAIYAILLAFGMLFPDERLFIFPFPIPIKAKWFVIIYAGIEFFSAISGTGGNVAHIAHLGGMVFGYLMIRYWRKHPTVGYGKMDAQQFFGNLSGIWRNDSRQGSGANGKKKNDGRWWRTASGKKGDDAPHASTHESDWDYNARKQERQHEVDRILDKIRKNGYDSLTYEEKRRLFEETKN